MRFWLSLILMASIPLIFAAALSAQSSEDQRQALRDAKAKAAMAEQRSETLRQEAANAERAADRLVAQRAVLSADIDTAQAQIEAANARIAIISRKQLEQRSSLGKASEPMLRLNAALQQMTGRPTVLMMAQPGQRSDYVHLRAVMATVEPQIRRRTAALRQQIVIQKDLKSQELVALKSLGDAKQRLAVQREALARLEGSSRNRADSLSADAAVEFEQAIAQGERARDLVENIDTLRLGTEKASELAALAGPVMRTKDAQPIGKNTAPVYVLPKNAKLISGFYELNDTGYRERGIRLALPPTSAIGAPAAGKVSFAGNYRSYGRIVIIEHGSGWSTLITNFDSLSVSEGMTVEQGQELGFAPAEKAQITIELRRNGRTMDIAALVS
ncbi:murein hydrolase activator EnvC family protein [Sphingorhabdus arenilitoris]|uniref:Murein hydrolase activator EnvC family protein n=1 Tax=Sphingorhabdus arenilitoris TaxID=1490041 RepID=A0ABV8RKI1_9SPHN